MSCTCGGAVAVLYIGRYGFMVPRGSGAYRRVCQYV